MKNLPNTLVETWLLLATNNSEENREASKIATKNIIHVFGNIDVARVYLEQNEKEFPELVVEEV